MANSERRHINLVGGGTSLSTKRKKLAKRSTVSAKVGRKQAARDTSKRATRGKRYSRPGRS